MSRGFKVLRPLIANVIPFVNISKFFKWKNMYIMTLRVAHWDTLDDRLALWYAKGKKIMSTLMESVMCLRFSMQEEDIFEHINDKCHLYTL